MENFRNKIYYYTPLYYPGFPRSGTQQKKHIYQYPYLRRGRKPNLDLRVFFNVINKGDNNVPWGSTYKYKIPRSIDALPERPSYSSVSERQKRFSREFFTDMPSNKSNKSNKKNNFDTMIGFMLFFVVFFMVIC